MLPRFVISRFPPSFPIINVSSKSSPPPASPNDRLPAPSVVITCPEVPSACGQLRAAPAFKVMSLPLTVTDACEDTNRTPVPRRPLPQEIVTPPAVPAIELPAVIFTFPPAVFEPAPAFSVTLPSSQLYSVDLQRPAELPAGIYYAKIHAVTNSAGSNYNASYSGTATWCWDGVSQFHSLITQIHASGFFGSVTSPSGATPTLIFTPQSLGYSVRWTIEIELTAAYAYGPE